MALSSLCGQATGSLSKSKLGTDQLDALYSSLSLLLLSILDSYGYCLFFNRTLSISSTSLIHYYFLLFSPQLLSLSSSIEFSRFPPRTTLYGYFFGPTALFFLFTPIIIAIFLFGWCQQEMISRLKRQNLVI